mmetsp:Transcript_801/g.1540  ORF Transcript_801/g.1540 Transcript_801/m.1540 type:complete len:256 (-) Transcript_801:1376-2143(-)
MTSSTNARDVELRLQKLVIGFGCDQHVDHLIIYSFAVGRFHHQKQPFVGLCDNSGADDVAAVVGGFDYVLLENKRQVDKHNGAIEGEDDVFHVLMQSELQHIVDPLLRVPAVACIMTTLLRVARPITHFIAKPVIWAPRVTVAACPAVVVAAASSVVTPPPVVPRVGLVSQTITPIPVAGRSVASLITIPVLEPRLRAPVGAIRDSPRQVHFLTVGVCVEIVRPDLIAKHDVIVKVHEIVSQAFDLVEVALDRWR